MAYKVLKALVQAFCYVSFRIKIDGMQNLPKTGDYMLCANHLSNWDPVVLIATNPRKVHFLAKSVLFDNKLLKIILNIAGVIPIKRGAADIAAIKSAMGVIKRGDVLGMFPTGTRSKSADVQDAKKGASVIGARTATTVVPVGITASYKPFSTVRINIGKPISLAEFKTRKPDAGEVDAISEKIYKNILQLSKVD